MKILSYNIQAAINSHSYLSYSYQWPRQILPTPSKRKTLSRIANFINDYDVVCLQEIELGGLRNGFKSQREQLLAQSHFHHDLVQTNRRVGKLSLHGNLILSKHPIALIVDSALPARIPGRGVLAGAITLENGDTLIIANTHLSLGAQDQQQQLTFIRDKLEAYPNVLICGDLNTTPDAPPLRHLTDHHYRNLTEQQATFPSWKPQKTLDHALLKGALAAEAQVIPFIASDHLPLSIHIHG